MPNIVKCDFITSFIIPSVQSDVEAVSWHIIHSLPAGSSAAPTVPEGNLPFQMLQLTYAAAVQLQRYCNSSTLESHRNHYNNNIKLG